MNNEEGKTAVFLLLAGILVFAGLAGGSRFPPHSLFTARPPAPVIPELSGQKADIGRVEIPILLYHYVEQVEDKQDTVRQALNIAPEIFAAQLETLTSDGYVFLTVAEVTDIAEEKISGPKKAAAITFDDGYGDFYTDVFPILKKFRAKATVYVISGLIGNKNFLSWEEIREIQGSGLVEIGAHTMSHQNLKGRDRQLLWLEVMEGKYLLEEALDEEVTAFAYPYGDFDGNTQAFIREAGFRSAAGTGEGVGFDGQNRYAFPRLRPENRTGTKLLEYLEAARKL